MLCPSLNSSLPLTPQASESIPTSLRIKAKHFLVCRTLCDLIHASFSPSFRDFSHTAFILFLAQAKHVGKNEDHQNEKSLQGSQPPSFAFGRNTKAVRAVGKLYGEQQQSFRCACIGSCWRGKPGKGLNRSGLSYITGEHFWLSLGLELETEVKNRGEIWFGFWCRCCRLEFELYCHILTSYCLFAYTVS